MWLVLFLAQETVPKPPADGGSGASPWVVALAVVAPVVGTIAVAWLTRQAKKASEASSDNKQQTEDKLDAAKILLAGWEERGRRVDELTQAAGELRREVAGIRDQHKECLHTLETQGAIIERQGEMLDELQDMLGMTRQRKTGGQGKRRADSGK